MAVELNWSDNSNNEDGFRIYRESGSGWNQIDTVGSNQTSYTDSSVEDGENYSYYVEAYTEHRSSSSGTQSITTSLPAPSGVSATVDANDQISVSWNDTINNGNYHVQINRDGNGWTDPSGGPTTTDHNDTSATYGPNSDNSYDSQVGIDSSFQFRVRSETAHRTSGWDYSGTVYTDPIPPHNPSVSRPDANTFEFTWENRSDVAHDSLVDADIEYREDTGGGYGSWQDLDAVNVPSGINSYTYSTSGVLSQDARYQFRIKQRIWYGSSNHGHSEWVFADYGNSGNVYFEDDFEDQDFAEWDSVEQDALVSSGTSPDAGFSGADSGTYYARLDASGRIEKNLGDLSGESDVIVKCVMAAGSMDNSSEQAELEWYNGSSWSNIHAFNWEYNKQGWVEVTALVPSADLSTDNRIAFDQEGGGGDYTYVDRVVVSDVLHEYTQPSAPTSLSVDNYVEGELTASWANNRTFANGDVEAILSLDGSQQDKKWTSPVTFTGLEDGELYEISAGAYYNQYRNGSLSQQLFSTYAGPVSSTTVLPSPSSLSGSSPIGYRGIDLSWTKNDNSSDGQFEVHRSTDGSNWTTIATISPSTTNYTDNSEDAGTQYYYRIRRYTPHAGKNTSSISVTDRGSAMFHNGTGIDAVTDGDADTT